MQTTTIDFDAPLNDVVERLRAAPDALEFGAIGLDAELRVAVYNATESRLAGLAPGTVLGKPFFTDVAPCMNNYLVAQRFADEPVLDATIDYVLTLRMRPTRVRMRLIARPADSLRWLLIARNAR